MRKPELRVMLLASTIAAFGVCAQAEEHFGIGSAATPREIKGWDIDIGRDGSNLPPGSGSVARGRTVFAEQCAACHGDKGQGGVGDRLVGGQGTLASAKPVRTVGSYSISTALCPPRRHLTPRRSRRSRCPTATILCRTRGLT